MLIPSANANVLAERFRRNISTLIYSFVQSHTPCQQRDTLKVIDCRKPESLISAAKGGEYHANNICNRDYRGTNPPHHSRTGIVMVPVGRSRLGSLEITASRVLLLHVLLPINYLRHRCQSHTRGVNAKRRELFHALAVQSPRGRSQKRCRRKNSSSKSTGKKALTLHW